MHLANIENFVRTKDYDALRMRLGENPILANEGIALGEGDDRKAHPLHRICDGVFSGAYREAEGLEIAGIFLEFGADVNGGELADKRDTPLTAAVSLYADRIALFYIERGADIHLRGCHGGTALHWAAWCGSDTVLRKLVKLGARVNELCDDFQSTPLFWAVHGLKFGGERNRRGQAECAKILLENGADKTIPNYEGRKPFDLVGEEDEELKRLLE